ncbi:MAG: AAA family ATPase, partial [Planctomycetales bacterium]|nr:AAA family ATPase [Planctomycetales bacterium]
MPDGIATLSLEPLARKTKRASRPTMHASGVLREFVLGPENDLLQRAIGLHQPAPAAESTDDSQPHVTRALLHVDMVPLLIHGPLGFGKTQLLQAIAATWSRERGNQRTMLTTGGDFARAYATAAKLDDLPRFLQRLQRVELLLIDDLDELARKAGAQNQLSIVLDHRQRHDRPVIMAAQQPLRLLNLNARLTSRIAGGLVVPLKLPTQATRRLIVDRLCSELELKLTEAARVRLSEIEPATVTQLVQNVHQLHLKLTEPHLLGQRNASTPVDETQIDELVQITPPPAVDPRDIVRLTAQYFGLKPRNLTGASRRKMDVLARSIAMF